MLHITEHVAHDLHCTQTRLSRATTARQWIQITRVPPYTHRNLVKLRTLGAINQSEYKQKALDITANKDHKAELIKHSFHCIYIIHLNCPSIRIWTGWTTIEPHIRR